jgi:GNAT superfamily N-acetyltransferase
VSARRPRAIAFYLPQFHPIPENDAAWGRGFTEWHKVAAARPLFVGHEQPHVPADLGFYDLRLPEARAAQAALASAYGIDAFCYWHYWFDGRRLLHRPFDEVLASGEPSLPFCLCWANENWTRRWDGQDAEVIVAQRYSADDDAAHARWLVRAFADPRYLRIDGQPLFLVYRILQHPNPAAFAARLREEARRAGVGELLLGRVESFPDERGDPRALGLDIAVEFQPDWAALTKELSSGPVRLVDDLGRPTELSTSFDRTGVFGVYDYRAVVEKMMAKPAASYPRFPCVTPRWDNSPRRGSLERSVIFRGATPALYEEWLRFAAARSLALDLPEPIVFVNAWNEWAEGNHLEPDQRHRLGFLEATRRVLAV